MTPSLVSHPVVPVSNLSGGGTRVPKLELLKLYAIVFMVVQLFGVNKHPLLLR